jgi:UDP-3-O-[3-hydroxymyristoyl] glucosamine N-acyltransferase
MGRASGRVHKAAKSWPISELCTDCEIQLITGRSEQQIDSVTSIAAPVSGALVLLTHKKYIAEVKAISGLVCLTSAELAEELQKELIEPVILVASRPRAAFGRVLALMFAPSLQQPGISALADIHRDAKIDPTARVEAFAVIGADCIIGPGCRIGAHTVLTGNVSLGADCQIGAHNVLSNLVCGEGVKTDAHCVIGKRGFGFDGQGGDLQVLPHLGQVIIGKGCDIGAGVTIDRGALDDTIIGEYVMIDNQCHIAHNVVIADNVIILGQAGIAGSVEIGKNSIIGGQVGIGDHIQIADNVVIASKSGVTKDIEKAGTYAGFPAMPAREFWLQMANARRKNTSSKS